jgi:prolyl oligopeptidase
MTGLLLRQQREMEIMRTIVGVNLGFVLASLTWIAAYAGMPAKPVYPVVERDAVVDNFFGTPVADPYRWLETLDSLATQGFVAAQNAVTRPYLDGLPRIAAIRSRLEQLFTYERFGVPVHAGANYFFLRNDGKQNQAALMVASSPAEDGRVLLDPASLRSDATVSLAEFVPSPNGKLLAYSLSDAGSDWKTWHVRDVATGADLVDLLRDIKFTSVSWSRDATGFYYSAYPNGDDQKQAAVRWHRLGEPQSQDRLIYAVRDHPTRVPYGTVSQDGRYLVLNLDEGTLSNGIVALSLETGVETPVFTQYDGIYQYLGSRTGAGTELLFRTTAGAPQGRVVAFDLGKPAADRMRVVVPESSEAMESATFVGDRVVVAYLKDAISQVRVFNAADGRTQGEVMLPGLGAVDGFTGEPDQSEGFFSYTDFTTPTRIYSLTPSTQAIAMIRSPQIKADVSSYVTEQVFYPGKDGTRIPMFLVHRKNMKRNGRNPVLLYGYGGFDISMTPAFSPATLAWLEMGGVYAVANLRGGGEYGEPWHLAGTRARKQNVFDDFIAAAQFLVREHITTHKRIAIRGGSNGGLLIGAVITQHPELFGAALPDVGVLDMLRYHLASANARQWADDYGLSEDAGDFKAQFAYSPVHNVARHHCFPPTLVTAGAQDNRVLPWHSFKFAAALQHAQRCANPVLLRVETRAGHSAGKPTWMQIEHYAEQWAFAAAALGMDDR